MELNYKGLRLVVPEAVYRPAEDSFMLADAAESLKGNILEIGCGCGLVSIICAMANPNNRVIGIDINPIAVQCSAENATRNNVLNAQFIHGNLFSPVEGKMFDAILFNPPYLPTSADEKLKGDLNKAFDGGPNGREVLDHFLSEFDRYLVPDGILLLIQSSLNNLEKTRRMLTSLGYKSEIITKRSFFFETIYLLKAKKPHV